MSFLRGTAELDARLVNHTGTMLRFRTSQLGSLPPADEPCEVILPDGRRVAGRFHRNPANPYVGGQEVVRWIKSWVVQGQPVDVVVHQVGGGNVVRVVPTAETSASQRSPVERQRVQRRLVTRLRGARTRAQRRVAYARLERDPALRALVLDSWDHRCQVEGCTVVDSHPEKIRQYLLDVHHLEHVSAGGTDSPLNVCLICAAHHALIHRAPGVRLTECTASSAEVIVDAAEVLRIERDVGRLW